MTESEVWEGAKALMDGRPLELGPYFSHILRRTPRQLLHILSYYKFAVRMIGAGKDVVDVGCSEGLGTVLLAEFARSCIGLDPDIGAIIAANREFRSETLRFRAWDLLGMAPAHVDADAAVCLGTIEHIAPEHERRFFGALTDLLRPGGIAVIGTPNIESDKYANPWTRAGHINLFSHERLRATCERFFEYVFLFAANDEVVHTGYLPMAHYLLALCVGAKRVDARAEADRPGRAFSKESVAMMGEI